MIIDIHIHPFCKEATVTPNAVEARRRMFARSDPQKRDLMEKMFTYLSTQVSIGDILHDMNEAGIDKACIVAMDLTTHYGVKLVTNEDVAHMALAHPDRFIPFASVDPSMGRVAVDMLSEAVTNLGCRGLKLVPPVQHFDFSDPKHYPLWEKALELNIPVWTHTAHQLSHPDSDARLGHPMLVEPVALKYPDLKIVLGHWGVPWFWDAWSLVVRHTNVYVDISANIKLYRHFPWEAYASYGAEHKVLFASDYPLNSFKDTLSALKAIDLPADFERKILGENSARLLGLV